MAGKTVEAVRQVIEPILISLGYELVDTEYVKRPDGMHLVVSIDKNGGGIGLDDCEKVSKAIDAPLDELDPTGGTAYSLDVSSPGLDRPLKTERDYTRNMGKEISVKLFSPIDGAKVWEGVLTAFDAEKVVIDCKGKIKEFNKKLIAASSPVIKF